MPNTHIDKQTNVHNDGLLEAAFTHRLPWTHSEIGWVTGNPNERGQRKIENWEKWWGEAGRQSDGVWYVIRGACWKGFELTYVRAEEGLEWSFTMEKAKGWRLRSGLMIRESLVKQSSKALTNLMSFNDDAWLIEEAMVDMVESTHSLEANYLVYRV